MDIHEILYDEKCILFEDRKVAKATNLLAPSDGRVLLYELLEISKRIKKLNEKDCNVLNITQSKDGEYGNHYLVYYLGQYFGPFDWAQAKCFLSGIYYG